MTPESWHIEWETVGGCKRRIRFEPAGPEDHPDATHVYYSGVFHDDEGWIETGDDDVAELVMDGQLSSKTGATAVAGPEP